MPDINVVGRQVASQFIISVKMNIKTIPETSLKIFQNKYYGQSQTTGNK